MTYAAAPTLPGTHVQLEKLSLDHEPDLREACADGELWKLWYATVPRPEAITGKITEHLAAHEAGERAPFAVVDKRSHRAVGMTALFHIDTPHKRVEMGHTWLAQSVHGTLINAEMKFLLLRRAFEVLGVHRVEWRVHLHNHRSRRAVEKIGAKLDGILRKHTILPNGTARDTCVYSLIDDEWPAAKASLEHRLEAVSAWAL